MSRSYKQVPYCGDKKGKDKKRCANSKVRMFLKDHDNELLKMQYKRVYDQYDICDYYWFEDWNTYWEKCQANYLEHPEWYKKPPNKKEEYRNWYKLYKMK